VHLQAQRLNDVIDWARSEPSIGGLAPGLYGSGEGGAIALEAIALRPGLVLALVLRGDHANLAVSTPRPQAVPALFIGSPDRARGPAEVARLASAFFVENLASGTRGASGTLPPPGEPPSPTFLHRQHAGAQLAAQLSRYAGRPDVIVLAIPHGGVPVGVAVARALGAPLDVIVTRRLCAPGMAQLALGAVGPDGVLVCDHELAPRFSPSDIGAEIARERRELQLCERALRGLRPPPEVKGKTVLLVDDGMITGTSMRAAVAWARLQLAARVVVAVPVAPAQAVKQVAGEADEVICLSPPIDFTSIASCYADFRRPDTGDVATQLASAHISSSSTADVKAPTVSRPS